MFYLLESPSTPTVLGNLWLVRHSPHIVWVENSVLAWSSFCHKFCLGVAFSAGFSCSMFQDGQTADLTSVSAEYLDLLRVFAIDLLSGTFPPRGRLYSLLALEREAMDKYIIGSWPHLFFLLCREERRFLAPLHRLSWAK